MAKVRPATKRELMDLADDVEKAAWLEFYLGHGDREPDGDRLSDQGKQWIADTLRHQAGWFKT